MVVFSNGSSGSSRGDPRSRCKWRHRSRREGRRSGAESIGHGHAVRIIGAAVEGCVVAGEVHCIVMESLRCGRNKCPVVSLEPLDYRRYISTHCGLIPEQFVIEPCLKDTALGCVEVLDILLPALKRMDEILDFRGCACGDKSLGLGSQCVA